MAYNSITTEEIATGESVSNTTQTKIKDNFDNLDGRVSELEQGTNVAYPPLVLTINGAYGQMNPPSTGLIKTTVNFDISITGVRIYIDKAGTAGDTEVDLKVGPNVGALTSALNTLPSVNYTEGDGAVSSNAVLNTGNVDVDAGGIISLDLTDVQTDAYGCFIRIDYVRR